MNHNSIIHHVSIINHDAEESFDFYRNILGLNLLMKTVNQKTMKCIMFSLRINMDDQVQK